MLKRKFQQSPSAKIHAAIEDLNPKYSTRSPIPNFHDRRAVAIYATGRLPIFYKVANQGSKVLVPCYVDVSGSQSHVIPAVVPVVSRLKNLVGEMVHCFSTRVSSCKITEFSKGNFHTTGGTDFNPVADHILKNNYKQAVILTDGYAWLNYDLINKLKARNIKITVGWTVPNPDLHPLSEVATKTFHVFED
jgi:hypothetical protein